MRLFRALRRFVIVAFAMCLAPFSPMNLMEDARAEWYGAGYGGLSLSSSLQNVTMNSFGQRIADQIFPQAYDPSDTNGRGTITQSFKTADLSLKNSPLFGGKFGYFFGDEGLPWLGLELDTFYTTPTIKTQRVTFSQEITYQPNQPQPSAICNQPAPPPTCPGFVKTSGTLSIQESNLRLFAMVANVVARYPGKVFQPYIGVGGGAFYFTSSSGSIQGRQVVPGVNAMAGVKVLASEEWGVFLEGRYNRATITNFDPTYGLSGTYSVFHLVGGVSYHF